MIVTTYYTNKKYRDYAFRLRDSCKELGVHCAAYMCPDQGNWEANVYQKPHMVRKAMNGYPLEDVLFIDADAVLKRYPMDVINTDWDMACFWNGPNLPVSATVFVANNARGRAFVDEWARGCDRGEHRNEDYHWMYHATQAVQGLRIGHLPPAYFWVEQDMRPRFPTAAPVVEHFLIGEHTFNK